MLRKGLVMICYLSPRTMAQIHLDTTVTALKQGVVLSLSPCYFCRQNKKWNDREKKKRF